MILSKTEAPVVRTARKRDAKTPRKAMNCAWLLGIPNSSKLPGVANPELSMTAQVAGLGSLRASFSALFRITFKNVPTRSIVVCQSRRKATKEQSTAMQNMGASVTPARIKPRKSPDAYMTAVSVKDVKPVHDILSGISNYCSCTSTHGTIE